ncbi:MAG: AAA family ATPase [Aliarcobacter sp.]
MQVVFNVLKIRNFRQIAEREFVFDPKTNFIIGKNGSGKTNTLHAITWLLFGKDLDDRSKFAVVPLNPDNTVTELEPDVELSMTINGEPHTVRRILRGGSTAQTFIDDMPCRTLKEFDAFVAGIFQTPDRFKIYTNPLHFPSMNWREQRELFMQFFPEPPREAVLERLTLRQGYEPVQSQELLNGNLERLGDKLAQDKKELEAERDKIRNQMELLDEQLEGQQGLDEDKLTIERHELREKVKSMRDVIKLAVEHNAGIEKKRLKLTNQRQNALSEMDLLKEGAKHRRERDVQALESEIKRLEDDRMRLQDAYVALKEEAQTCQACGQPLPEESVADQKTAIQAKGIKLATEIEDKQKDLDDLKNQMLAVPDLSEFINTADRAMGELSSLDDLIEVPTLDDDMIARLDELDRTLARADVHKENIDRKQKLTDRLREINRLFEETEQNLREVADFMFYRSELIVEAVNKEFKSISVKVLEIQKNGVAKETFEILKDGVPFVELNTAGQLEAGLELAGFIKSKLDIDCPVLIDNGERFTDLDLLKIKGQLIATKAVKGSPLDVAYKVV